jgi:hypothetical protein
MQVEILIAQLKANRYLRTEAEAEAFDAALASLASLPQSRVADSLPELLLVFDDSAEHFEVMWGLLHYVEDFDTETQLHALGEAAPTMLDYASGWVRRLVKRILNSESARMTLRETLPSLSPTGQAALRQVLDDIADLNWEKRAQVEAVLAGKLGHRNGRSELA